VLTNEFSQLASFEFLHAYGHAYLFSHTLKALYESWYKDDSHYNTLPCGFFPCITFNDTVRLKYNTRETPNIDNILVEESGH
jgi:hypothetical protein